MKHANRRFIPVLALVLGASISALPYAAAAAQPGENDSNLRAEIINKALNKPNLKDVKVSAHDGVVTLTGTVPLFDLKQEADKRTHKIKGVQTVSNEIEVAGSNLPDSVVEAKLVKAISYDRIGNRHHAFQRHFRAGAGWNRNALRSCVRACRRSFRLRAGSQHARGEKCCQRGPSRSAFADG